MDVPITRKMLIDWAGQDVVRDAEILVDKGMVLEATYDPPAIRGAILWNNRELKTGLRILSATTIESECPCYTNRERGLVCPHVIALALMLVRRATDPEREQKYQQELRRASRLAQVQESEYIQRVAADTPGALPARLVLTLDPGWEEDFSRGEIRLCAAVEAQGQAIALGHAPRNIPFLFSKRDESLLYVLEDISEGPARSEFLVGRADFLNIIRLCGGHELQREGAPPVIVNEAPMTTLLRMALQGDSGRLIVAAHTELPFLREGDQPVYLVDGRSGWVYGADNLWPLQNLLPTPYHEIYRQPIFVERPDVLRFIGREMPVLAKTARVESDLSLDLFSVEPATPRFRLVVCGSPASLAATLYAEYGELRLVAAKPDALGHFAIPDPDDVMRYLVRNDKAEKEALGILAMAGFQGECGDALGSIVDRRHVLNFLGSKLPALRRIGWKVDLEGRIEPFMEDMEFATPVVHIEEGRENWFDVGFNFEDARGASLSPAEIQQAIRKGDSFIERGGRTILIDSDAIESMTSVFADCDSGESTEPGHFRLSNIHAAFIKASLDALDGVDVEDTPEWRERALQANRAVRVERTDLGSHLNTLLRPYQRDGVDWLRFLEESGFSGLLADEMGLGKTLQALAWLGLPRVDPSLNGMPSLVVCPTSLVENWAEEAARYTPALKVLTLTGSERHDKWEQVENSHLVVTSYALLRRDLARYLEITFAAAILDEAQHIKNRSTQNALAAKQIRAHHRLVLTGTPVENSVSDLWSIMDFLMPSYLGRHEAFRRLYELPISRQGPEAELAQGRLRRKLQPFLLRRLKKDVARELPPKIEKVSFCELTPDQALVYKELLESSRRRVHDLVSKQGFNRCRMEILTTLLRLRQACCHLDLLKLPGLNPAQPSAKMDLFFELVDEALDGGHRILVFSQFVSMLAILRRELDSRSIEYCYLDGSTKDRMKEVHRFNTQRSVPLFLISLKAGGTGLNLTGADMVIHFDPWWNPAVENQATDRAYRIGQKRTVYSIKLVTRSSVEQKVIALQDRKRAVIDATIESDEAMVQSLSWEDVQELLEL